jgi:hypothetical protein
MQLTLWLLLLLQQELVCQLQRPTQHLPHPSTIRRPVN